MLTVTGCSRLLEWAVHLRGSCSEMLLVSPFLHIKILLGLQAKGSPLLDDEVLGGRLNHLSSLSLPMPAIFPEFCPLCLAIQLTVF